MSKYEFTYISEDTGQCEAEIIQSYGLRSAIEQFQTLIQKDFDIVECLDVEEQA